MNGIIYDSANRFKYLMEYILEKLRKYVKDIMTKHSKAS